MLFVWEEDEIACQNIVQLVDLFYLNRTHMHFMNNA